MFRLLVAMDFSECSRVALDAAMHVADRTPPAELLVLTVLPPREEQVEAANELEDDLDRLRSMVADARGGRGVKAGVSVRYAATRGQPAEEIARLATSHHSDLVVVGTHGRTGLDRLLLGSVAETVVRIAPCSVLTVKPRPQG